LKRWLIPGVLGLLMLQACSKPAPTRYGAPIEGYNHTSAAINYFSVNGGGGSNFGPHLGGGSQTCCASMPVKWYPGLTAVVEWEKDPTPHAYGAWPEPMFSDAWRERMKREKLNNTRHRAIVEVAPYEELGVVSVHFLPCDQIKVAAGRTYRGMPEHPYNYPYKMEVPTPCPIP
jgi:hypothetical protein